MGSKTESLTVCPSGYAEDHSYDSSTTNLTNGFSGTSENTYAKIVLTTGSGAQTRVYYTFDLSAIPADATIDSVDCSVRSSISTVSSSYVRYRTVQMYSGLSAKGSSALLTSTVTTRALDCGAWTREELDDCRLKLYAVRGTSNTSAYIRFYGADLTVTYTYSSEQFMLKTGGAWAVASTVYKKVNGVWIEQAELSGVIEDGVRYRNGGALVNPT